MLVLTSRRRETGRHDDEQPELVSTNAHPLSRGSQGGSVHWIWCKLRPLLGNQPGVLAPEFAEHQKDACWGCARLGRRSFQSVVLLIGARKTLGIANHIKIATKKYSQTQLLIVVYNRCSDCSHIDPNQPHAKTPHYPQVSRQVP